MLYFSILFAYFYTFPTKYVLAKVLYPTVYLKCKGGTAMKILELIQSAFNLEIANPTLMEKDGLLVALKNGQVVKIMLSN